MRTHRLKTWPQYFEAVLKGTKRFDIRVDDRDFAVGDCPSEVTPGASFVASSPSSSIRASGCAKVFAA